LTQHFLCICHCPVLPWTVRKGKQKATCMQAWDMQCNMQESVTSLLGSAYALQRQCKTWVQDTRQAAQRN
jgi:hypothetical protein